MKKFNIGSLFSGSGGFELAASRCGGKPIWCAEIEPYPIAVTTSRFPGIKHLGDVSKINGAEIEPVDVITFGSPCQDMSVAGKRAGLKHADNGDDETTRSGLFMEAVRIIKEMRKATNGRYPTFAIWENVPGAYSSNKGEDFRVVLEELIKITEPTASVPPADKNKWPYADCYVGEGWSLAYRTLDAQYWGVPQRRRRIYLVADFAGERASKILFESQSVPGDTSPSGEQREGTATDTQGCATMAGKSISFVNRGHYREDGIGETLRSNCNQDIPCIIEPRKYIKTEQDGNILDDQGGQQINIRTDGQCPTLRAEMHGNIPAILSLEPGIASRCGGHIYEGVSGTIRACPGDNAMSVCYMEDNTQSSAYAIDSYNQTVRLESCQTLKAVQGGDGVPAVIVLENHPADSRVDIDETGKSQTLTSRMGTGGGNVPLVMQQALNTYGVVSKGNGDCFLMEGKHCAISTYTVRRLTPTECARLQGFPDEWGHPNKKDDMTDEEVEFWNEVRNTHASITGKEQKQYNKKQILAYYNKLHTDSAEYKMWGNGIALPCAKHVMKGIAEAIAMTKEETEQ